jgi:hypothetical protein
MTTLRRPDIVGPRVLSQLRSPRITAHSAVRDRSYTRPAHIKPRQRADWLRSMAHVLLIGRDLLCALWAIAVIAFWLAIVASFLL